MAKSSGGGGNGGRSGGSSGAGTDGDAGQPGEVVRQANTFNDAIKSGAVNVQQLTSDTIQFTHAKATLRVGKDYAEVWSSSTGEKAFKPSPGIQRYAEKQKGRALREFEKRTGLRA